MALMFQCDFCKKPFERDKGISNHMSFCKKTVNGNLCGDIFEFDVCPECYGFIWGELNKRIPDEEKMEVEENE